MSPNIVVVQISAPLLSGFRIRLAKDDFDAMNDDRVLEILRDRILAYFTAENLVDLVAFADRSLKDLHLDRYSGSQLVYASDRWHLRWGQDV